MTLPKPQLDDRTFQDLVEEERKLIPRYAPEWTDHNWSDPGITVFDLFAWLSEITLYRLNLITDRHRLAYLRLLGIRPRLAQPARVDLTFTPDREIELKKGAPFSSKTPGEIVTFELEEDITIVPLTLRKVIVSEGPGLVFDRTKENEVDDQFYMPFGLALQEESRLYLGFRSAGEKVPESVSLMCYLYEKGLGDPPKHGDEEEYPWRNATLKSLKWEYYQDKSNEWVEIPSGGAAPGVWDGTCGFRKSARITFRGLTRWAQSTIPEWREVHNLTYFWIRCILVKSEYEYPPRIEVLQPNTVPALQGITYRQDTSPLLEQWTSNGLPDQVFRLDHTPILDGTLELVLYDLPRLLKFSASDLETQLNITRTQASDIAVKLITISEDIEESISGGSPLRVPGRIAEILNHNTNLALSLLELVREQLTEVEDLSGSGCGDTSFTFDREGGIIRFGDGINGRVPPRGSQIACLAYRVGGGPAGNIRAFCEWIPEGGILPGITATNYTAASGGMEAEPIDEAIERFQRGMKIPWRAVTSSDFEYLATHTPGVRVAKARAIANYSHNKEDPGAVTVVIVPDTWLEFFETPPVPSPGMIYAVCRHLDQHRLITTKIIVTGPVYVRVDVSLTIALISGYKEDTLREEVARQLRRFLHPTRGWFDEKGWPIGRTVSPSEVLQAIGTLKGVDCVTGITLSGDKKDANIDSFGNLVLTDQTMTVYAGSISVNLERGRDRCIERRRGNGVN